METRHEIESKIKTLCYRHINLMREFNSNSASLTRKRKLELQREIINLDVEIETLQDELDEIHESPKVWRESDLERL